jgi:hypothetical protein
MRAAGSQQYSHVPPQRLGVPIADGNGVPASAHGVRRGDGDGAGNGGGEREGGAMREGSGGLSAMDCHMDSLPSLSSLPRCESNDVWPACIASCSPPLQGMCVRPMLSTR